MKVLNQYWWILALQGLFLLVAGAIGVFDPNVYLEEVVQYLGLIFLVFGFLMDLFGLILRKKARYWSFMFVIGLLEMGFGLAILANPNASTEIFTYVIAGWAFIIGIIQATFGFSRRGSLILNLVNAIISLAFAALIIWNPFATMDALTYIVGFYSIILGIMVIYYSFSWRNWSAKRIKAKGRTHDEGDETDPNMRAPSD